MNHEAQSTLDSRRSRVTGRGGASKVALLLGAGGLMVAAATLSVAGTAGASGSGLGGLQQKLQNASKATFEATYVVSNPGSANTTMVLAQSPGNSYMKTAGATLVSTGKKTYYCSGSGGSATTCISESGANPLAGLSELFSSTVIVTELKVFQGEVAEHIPGLSVKTSSKTVAGQPSTCVTVKAPGQSKTEIWCVANSKGFLTYENSGSDSVTLKAYSGSPPASLFKLPQGATVMTTPNIPGT